MGRNKVGKIDISELNVPPERHEYETAKFFADRGLNVSFVRPRYIVGFKNPDFRMMGKIWETKSPIGNSKRTYEDNFRKAIKQSENVIFDLRRLSIEGERNCLQMLHNKRNSPRVKTLIIILKDGRLLTIKGKFVKL